MKKLFYLNLFIIVTSLLLISCSTSNLVSDGKKAFDNGDLDLVENLLMNESINQEIIDSILIYAIESEYSKYLENLKHYDKDKVKIISTIIQKSNNPNYIMSDCKYILSWALKIGDDEFIESLVSNKQIDLTLIDSKNKPFVYYVRINKIDHKTLSLLLDRGLEYTPILYNTLKRKDHPLHKAIYSYDLEKVQLVLKSIDEGTEKNINWSPFNSLFRRYSNNTIDKTGNFKLFELLVNKGFKLDFVKDNGKTLLHDAVETGDLRILSAILNAGIDVNKKDQFGNTAMFYCSMRWGAGPGKEADPIFFEIEELFKRFGFVKS